jgi:hypothetical protein
LFGCFFVLLLKLATCAPPQTRVVQKTCFLFLLFVPLGQGWAVVGDILIQFSPWCTPLHFFSAISRSKGKMILGYTRGVLAMMFEVCKHMCAGSDCAANAKNSFSAQMGAVLFTI